MESPTMDRSSNNLSAERAGRIRPGLAMLLEAHADADGLGRSAIDFAIEVRELHDAGLHDHDLRWLVVSGHVEVTSASTPSKAKRPSANDGLVFSDLSRFFLTLAGVALAMELGRSAAAPPPAAVPSTSTGHGRKRPRPQWNSKAGELLLGSILVKRIEQPAANLRTILDAFEEERWREVIDDPLPPRAGLDSHQRLRDAIRRLNLCQVNRLLRFHSANRGTAIKWEVRG